MNRKLKKHDIIVEIDEDSKNKYQVVDRKVKAIRTDRDAMFLKKTRNSMEDSLPKI